MRGPFKGGGRRSPSKVGAFRAVRPPRFPRVAHWPEVIHRLTLYLRVRLTLNPQPQVEVQG